VTGCTRQRMSKIGREYSTNLKDLRAALSTRRPSSQTTTKTYTHLDHRPKSREPDWSQSIWQANESILRTRSLRFYEPAHPNPGVALMLVCEQPGSQTLVARVYGTCHVHI
jgi:hypothetical protein